MKRLFLALLLTLCGTVSAQDLYMVRSSLAFPEAMSLLQQTIGRGLPGVPGAAG